MIFNKFSKGPSLLLKIFNDSEGIKKVTISHSDFFSYELFTPDAELRQALDEQLLEYIQKKRSKFNLPLKSLGGTPFFQEGLKALCEIKFGETISYKELAKRLNRPKAFRAVGNICHKNPYPFFIPCHRVIGSDGSLTGFAFGEKMKKALLLFEKF